MSVPGVWTTNSAKMAATRADMDDLSNVIQGITEITGGSAE